ncbi:MAG: hypothetical protein QNK37_06250 [Acidobacteriota bacterium]|nr:hypothetical protein [Acidobacteriota bacterium]
MDLEFGLEEEIGNPELFVGRQRELDYFLRWVEKVKKKIGWSTAVLARRRKGKTALLQRLFNILYTRNDPKIIPFYLRIPERESTLLEFSDFLYRGLMSAYLGFKKRLPELINTPPALETLAELAADDPVISKDIQQMERFFADGRQEQCWEHASSAGHRISLLKDERIVQILDEFQYLDKYIYYAQGDPEPMILTGTYQYRGSSKISPQIIAGSYIAWLSRIIRRMVGRYNAYYLQNLSDDEALIAVYNYARVYGRDVTDETAAWMVEACNRDPFTIASMFESNLEPKDLTTVKGASAVLDYETTIEKGRVAQMWMEYLATIIHRTNDINAKKIMLYLAKYKGKERNRKQIAEDLNLDLSDQDLEDMLSKLVAGDIIARGETSWTYRGLGDPVFDMVFRKIFEPEIQQVDIEVIRKDIAAKLEQLEQDLKSERGRVSRFRGETAEYRMRYKIAMAGQKCRAVRDLAHHPENPEAPRVPDILLAPFETIAKHNFHAGDVTVECDLYAQADDGPNLVVEVKDWERKVNKDRITDFIAAKALLTKVLTRDTLYLFYSEQPLAEANIERLQQAGILYADGDSFSR